MFSESAPDDTPNGPHLAYFFIHLGLTDSNLRPSVAIYFHYKLFSVTWLQTVMTPGWVPPNMLGTHCVDMVSTASPNKQPTWYWFH